MENVHEGLARLFGCTRWWRQRDDLHGAVLPAPRATAALAWLKQSTSLVQLTHLSAVDWPEDGQFQLTYLLTDPHASRALMLDTRIDREQPEVESVHRLWPQAVTYEQEINEMFGIRFRGSPRQGTPFILEGWSDIPPMRRDFDTVAYVERHHPMRPGRAHTDPRTYIGKVFGERGYLGEK